MRDLTGIAAIILAAGFSRRLGQPKQTLVLADETLIDRAVRVAMEAGPSPVIVVTQPECDFAAALRERGCQVVENHEAEEGIASSIRVGITAASQRKTPGVVIMTCDQVALTPAHLRELCDQPNATTGSAYSGRIGIPAYFPGSSFHDLLQLTGDTGARELLRNARAISVEDLALDVDCKEDIALAIVYLAPKES